MGLAASQARFLAITSRKAQCEFRSMQIAQEKLSVTRELADVTQVYQNSLNATKMVWETDPSGGVVDLSETCPFSYGTLMTPSGMNNYQPYFITNQSGRIVLNGRMAAAAGDAGINESGGTASGTGYKDFLNALAKQGYITPTQLESLTKTDTYQPQAGIGGEPMDKTQAKAMTLQTLASMFDKNVQEEAFLYSDSSGNKNVYRLDKADGTIWKCDDPNTTTTPPTFSSEPNSGVTHLGYVTMPDGSVFTVDGTATEAKSGEGKLSLYDLLTKDVVQMWNVSPETIEKDLWGDTSVSPPKSGVLDDIFEQLEFYLKTDPASNLAFDYALSEIKDLIKAENKYTLATHGGSKKNDIINMFSDKVPDYNCLTYYRSSNNDWGGKDHYALSLSNVIKSFLTYYAQAAGGFANTDLCVQKDAANSVYITDFPDYYYVTTNTEACTEKDLYVAEFYSSLYNNLCDKGWTTVSGADIEDDNYLEHAIKNAQLFISSQNQTDYQYYQDPYQLNEHLSIVTDDDAIARAEAQYLKEKAILSYKEDKLEIDMKNIDTELSALTTEYDTVKNMITKNAEKIFSMFST